jgi:hypothetical protein
MTMIDHSRAFWALLVTAFAAAVSFGAAVWVGARAAHAHDWYPIECCHSLDCAPVTSTAYVAGAAYDAAGKEIANPLPRMVVTTKIGTAVVPDDLPRRPSPDGQMHACIRNDGTAGMHVMCIFIPPGL